MRLMSPDFSQESGTKRGFSPIKTSMYGRLFCVSGLAIVEIHFFMSSMIARLLRSSPSGSKYSRESFGVWMGKLRSVTNPIAGIPFSRNGAWSELAPSMALFRL